MEKPEGFNDESGRFCALKRSIYGLKQSSKNFHLKMKEVLLELGLKQNQSDGCLFFRNKSNRILISTYVDDLMLCYSNESDAENLIKGLKGKLKLTCKPLSYYLGLEILVQPDTNDIYIHQRKYIQDVLKRFGMTHCKPATTPADRSIYEIPDDDNNREKFPYREIIGSLMYASTGSRPDISFIVNYLSRFMENPQKGHYVAAMRVLRYLNSTQNYGLRFAGNQELTLVGYSDSDFASDRKTRKSTSGEVILLGESAVSWSSSKQNCVALSSFESELIEE